MFLKNKEIFAYLPTLILMSVLIGGFFLMFFATPQVYITVIKNSEFWDAFFYANKISLYVVFFSSLFFLFLYYLLFILKFEYKKEIALWAYILQIPILIPYAFCALLFFLIFFPAGIFSNIFPFLLGTSSAIIIAYAYKTTPFLLLICLPALMGLKNEEINLHKIYSKSAFLFFYKILLKRNLKVYFFGIFIIFSYIFNAYEIPYILGGTLKKMPAVLVYEQLHELEYLSIQKAYVMSLIYFILVISFVPIFFVLYKLLKKVL